MRISGSVQRRASHWFAMVAAVLILQATSSAQEPADVVLRGGTVITCDAQNTNAEAVAIRGTTITAVGTSARIQPLIGPKTRVIELQGRTVVPGFIEGHGHLEMLGQLRIDVDLSKATTWDEVIELMAARAKVTPKGHWVVGRGWHQEHWTSPPQAGSSERYPVHAKLSAAIPDHPVLMAHGSGHMAMTNAKGLEAAKLTRDSQPPAGGEYLKDANGELTGILRETAQGPLYAACERWKSQRTAEEIQAEEDRVFELAIQECLSKGVTSFQDAGISFGGVKQLRQLAEKGKLGLRMWVMVSAQPAELEKKLPEFRCVGDFNNRLTVRAIKCMADGALGAHGALLLEPYHDLPEAKGLRVQSLDRIRQTAALAAKYDYQLCTHAIGDKAVRDTLNIYEGVLRAEARKDRRWRIEHLQHVHPADFMRLADLGVIASMQFNHATSDGPFVVTRLGEERARHGAYAWRSVVDSGARLVNGTDAPVEDVAPLPCLQSGVTRRMKNGQQFFPEQCLTPLEALRSYTIDAAYGAFEDDIKGSIEAGKLADMVILSGNPLMVPGDEIGSLKVEATILDGQTVYEAPQGK